MMDKVTDMKKANDYMRENVDSEEQEHVANWKRTEQNHEKLDEKDYQNLKLWLLPGEKNEYPAGRDL